MHVVTTKVLEESNGEDGADASDDEHDAGSTTDSTACKARARQTLPGPVKPTRARIKHPRSGQPARTLEDSGREDGTHTSDDGNFAGSTTDSTACKARAPLTLDGCDRLHVNDPERRSYQSLLATHCVNRCKSQQWGGGLVHFDG